MNKTLFVSALTAAAFAGSVAFAAEEMKTDAAKEAVKTETTKAAPAAGATNSELQDGTHVLIKGDNVFVIGKDGKETAAPDGTHTLKDGKTLTTKGGMVVK